MTQDAKALDVKGLKVATAAVSAEIDRYWNDDTVEAGHEPVAAAAISAYLSALRDGEATEGTTKWLGELLAVIHRDGGQYQALHGDEKAVADAHAILAALRSGDATEGLLQSAKELRDNANGDCGAVMQALHLEAKAAALRSAEPAAIIPAEMIERFRQARDYFATTSHHTHTKLLDDFLEVSAALSATPSPAQGAVERAVPMAHALRSELNLLEDPDYFGNPSLRKQPFERMNGEKSIPLYATPPVAPAGTVGTTPDSDAVRAALAKLRSMQIEDAPYGGDGSAGEVEQYRAGQIDGIRFAAYRIEAALSAPTVQGGAK